MRRTLDNETFVEALSMEFDKAFWSMLHNLLFEKYDKRVGTFVWKIHVDRQKFRYFEINSCLNFKLIISALFKKASGQSNVF